VASTARDVARMIEEEVARASSPLEPEQMAAIGDLAINIITLRTKSGLDADRKPFVPYTPTYQRQREKIGRSSTTVDLAVTGHMQQGITKDAHGNEVSLHFVSPLEERKAIIHNDGVDTNVSVRSHTRRVFVNVRNGQRVSAKAGAKAKRQGAAHIVEREEKVTSFRRHQRTPKREWFDIRATEDEKIIEDAIDEMLSERVK